MEKLNPIDRWHDLRNKEIMAGGDPKYCIMGSDDFAELSGAIIISHHSNVEFSLSGPFTFNGVEVRESRSQKRGIYFG